MTNLISRRRMLKTSSLIALSPTLPAFLANSARAEGKPGNERILVVIQLDGGNDGINTLVPFRDDGYARNRKALRLTTDELLKVNDEVGLHPAMRSAADMLEDGRLEIIQGVGYPNPNRSHDVSMNIWQTGRTDSTNNSGLGWIGRTTDELQAPADGSPSSVLSGTESPPIALTSRRSASIALAHLHDLRRIGNSTKAPPRTESLGNDRRDLRSFVQRTAVDAYTTADLLQEASSDSAAAYPNSQLASRLRMISQLIKAGFATRFYYAVHGGFDTHYLQLPTHSQLLNQLSTSLKAFMDDLRVAKLDDRVLVVCFSEFGRRVEENASQGTDHGTAGPVFLAGPAVKSGLFGRTPSLTELSDGDLKMAIDFRQVYATLLKGWLDASPESILGEQFAHIDILRAS